LLPQNALRNVLTTGGTNNGNPNAGKATHLNPETPKDRSVVSQRKAYDEAVLVFELARRRRPTAEIARELGVSVELVNKIAAGQRRPHLQRGIRKARRTLDNRLRALVRRKALAAFRRHMRIIRTGSARAAGRSREYILSRTISHEGNA